MNKEILEWINKQIKSRTSLLSMANKPKGPICINSGSLKNDLKILNQIKKELEEKDIMNYAKLKCETAPVLDEVEIRYLKNIIRPFKNKIDFVILVKNTMFLEQKKNVRIRVHLKDHDFITLPFFKEGDMYKAMEPNVKYTLKDLGITYE